MCYSSLLELQLAGAGEGPEAAGAALQALTYYNRPARVAYLRELVQALLDGKNEACHPLDIQCIPELHSLLSSSMCAHHAGGPGHLHGLRTDGLWSRPQTLLGNRWQHCDVPHALM